jgi:hypothetical protein
MDDYPPWTEEEREKLIVLKNPKSRRKWVDIARQMGRDEADCVAEWDRVKATLALRAQSSSSSSAALEGEGGDGGVGGEGGVAEDLTMLGDDGDADQDEDENGPHYGKMRPIEAFVKHGFFAFTSFAEARKRARDALDVAEDAASSHRKRFEATGEDEDAVIASRMIAQEWASFLRLTDGDADGGGEDSGEGAASA